MQAVRRRGRVDADQDMTILARDDVAVAIEGEISSMRIR